VRGPYLQQVGATSAIVVWATREAGPATVEYRTGSGSFSIAAATSTFRSSSSTGIPSYYQHEAVLPGLSPGTTYEYDLRVGGVDPTPGVLDQFHTAPVVGTGTIRLVAFGDSGIGSTAQGQIAGLLNGETFDLALHTGDISYGSGTYAQYESYFFPYYRNWLRRTAIFPSIGNHDDVTASATPYRRFFVLPPDGASAAYPNNAERFYSFDYGPVHFIALDTQAAFLSSARRQAQLAWLTDDLQNSQHQPWRVVFFHRPPYSSGAEHGSDLTVRQAFGPLFEQYNVQVVLNGHDHDFERSVPWRVSTDTTRQAVTYVVTGGGGAGLYAVGRNQWTAYSRSAHHYVRALVSPTDFTIEAVGTDGVFDRFTLNRSLQDNDTAAPEVSIDAPSSGEILTGVEQVAVTAVDDSRVEKVDLWVDGQLREIDLTAPYSFSLDTTGLANGPHTLQAIAYDIDGRRTPASRSVTVSNGTSTGDIVLYASLAPVRVGSWRVVSDTTAAGSQRLEQPQAGAATIEPPLSNPTHYVELSVNVVADKNYRVWLRMKGASNSGYNDSVWVQTSGTVDSAGTPVFRIGTTSATRVNLQDCSGSCTISGWGWQDNGFGTGVLGPVLRFASGGTQTIRIQAREDGVSIDQIVLSPGTYLNAAPGALRNDTTILPRNQ
jgi:hypothetical protein